MAKKTCILCNESKPLDDFRKHRRSCRTCNNRKNKEWRVANPNYMRNYNREYSLNKLYGLSVEQVEEMYRTQNGKCLICEVPGELQSGSAGASLHIDHDHVTGRIRALLCSSCNNGLGRFKDNPKLLRRAADYLEGELDD